MSKNDIAVSLIQSHTVVGIKPVY